MFRRKGDQKIERPLFLQKPYIDANLIAGPIRRIVTNPFFVDHCEW